MNAKSLSVEARGVLVECARRMNEIAAAPAPPKWQTWAVAEHEELREYGPRYEPKDWFGGGEPLPEKYRVKYLRAVHELSQNGLLTRGMLNGRMTHAKLTPEGLELAYELEPSLRPAEPKPKAKKAAKKAGGTKRAKPAPASGATDERADEPAPDAAAVGDVGAEGARGE